MLWLSQYIQKFLYNLVFTLKGRLIGALLTTCILLISIIYGIVYKMFYDFEETLLSEKLLSDVQYAQSIIGRNEWYIKNDCLYNGDINFGDGTETLSNNEPFIKIYDDVDTLTYLFIKTSDEQVQDVNNEYDRGHYKRISGKAVNSNNESIIGTYIAKNVADELDQKDIYIGVANVEDKKIFCIYKTLKDRNGTIVGALVAGQEISYLSDNINIIVNTILFAITICCFIFAVVMYLLLNRWTRAIDMIIDYLDKLDINNLSNERIFIKSHDEMEKIAKTINTFVDLLKEKERLHLMAETDTLTKLYNRYWLDINVERIFNQNRNKLIAIESLDIDYFKEFNDTYGHAYGDYCLESIAGAMQYIFNDKNMYCIRHGGDELITICIGYDSSVIERKMRELQVIIQNLNIEHKNSKVSNNVTISQGCAIVVNDGTWTYEKLLKKSDDVLYQVKENGKNNYKLIDCNKNTLNKNGEENNDIRG